MKLARVYLWTILALALSLAARTLQADDGAGSSKTLLDLSAADVAAHLSTEAGNAGAEYKVVDGPNGKALRLSVAADSKGYPGVSVKPDGAVWDLSAFGHVAVKVTNTGDKTHLFAVRVDNEGDWHDGPWNTEQAYIKANETATLTVIFGYTFGHKPGYALKPGAVIRLLLFTNGAKDAQEFRIDSVVATGPAGETPPLDPKTVRIVPKDGAIVGPGAATDAASATKFEAAGGATAKFVDGQALQVDLPAKKGTQTVSLQPPIGRWNLTHATDISLKVKNTGPEPLTVSAQASGGGATDLIAAPTLAPGAAQEIVVPFAPAAPWQGIPNSGDKTNWSGVKGTGTSFTSDATSEVKLTVSHGDAASSLLVQSVTAKVLTADLPAWIGKRPPVPEAEAGNWVKTLDDQFDGASIDEKTWSIYGPNFWDKKTHWSKDNLVLDGGKLKMRFEKKTGPHNDVPDGTKTDYACGFLDTYGKWVQRYGYFEARVKLPEAPGLWPTFWLTMDRGGAAGPQWKRQSTDKLATDTGVGGMELDIMEHLTRWGPYRYNIAQHWDGYGKNHKQTGSTYNYIRPDKDGFITVGMLWTPGHLAYYCNGKMTASWDADRIADVPAAIILETTTGGWDNNAVDNKQLPVDYIVNYVRVWQRKDLASDVDGYAAKPAPWPLKPPY